ncbi:hypothetical protein TNCV_1760871 [Trichonephila clavipes]|nr:hypothetical protein TNCV_1760871 [Trichonephila clavipes]
MTQKYCGVVAGEVLRKVLLYHRDYDFMCARVEKELAYFSKFSPAPDIEKFLSSPKTSPTPDILTNTHEDKEQEFENTNLHRIGSTVENEETSALSTEKFATETVPNEMEILSSNPVIPKNDLSATKSTPYLNPDPSLDATDALSDLQSIFVQKDPSAEEHFSFQKNHYSSVKENEYSSLGVELFVLNTSKQLHHTLNSRRKILSSFPYQDYATELATFGLYETIDHGVQYYLGCGYAVVSRTKSSLLNNTYCIWTKYLDQEKMFKCSVHIAEACIFEADDLGSVIFDLEYKTSLLIYDIVDGIHRKKASIFAQYYKPNTKVFPPGHISCRMLPKKALVS